MGNRGYEEVSRRHHLIKQKGGGRQWFHGEFSSLFFLLLWMTPSNLDELRIMQYLNYLVCLLIIFYHIEEMVKLPFRCKFGRPCPRISVHCDVLKCILLVQCTYGCMDVQNMHNVYTMHLNIGQCPLSIDLRS